MLVGVFLSSFSFLHGQPDFCPLVGEQLHLWDISLLLRERRSDKIHSHGPQVCNLSWSQSIQSAFAPLACASSWKSTCVKQTFCGKPLMGIQRQKGTTGKKGTYRTRIWGTLRNLHMDIFTVTAESLANCAQGHIFVSRRQGDQEFRASLGYIARVSLILEQTQMFK